MAKSQDAKKGGKKGKKRQGAMPRCVANLKKEHGLGARQSWLKYGRRDRSLVEPTAQA